MEKEFLIKMLINIEDCQDACRGPEGVVDAFIKCKNSHLNMQISGVRYRFERVKINELKSCPFCKTPVTLLPKSDPRDVYCPGCKVSFQWLQDDKSQIIELFNRRD